MGPVSCRRGNPKLSDSLSPLHHSDTAKAPMETEPCRAKFGAARPIQEAPDALQSRVGLLNPLETWPWKAALTTQPPQRGELPAPAVLGNA